MVFLPPSNSASYATSPRRPFNSAMILEETNFNGTDAQGGDTLIETPLHEGTNLSTRSNDIVVDDVADEHQSPPLCARPPGRKAAKRVKRQASIEAQSSLREHVANSLEDMTNSNSVEWNKATELHEQELRASIRNKKMQAIIGRIVIEKEAMTIDKLMLDVDPTALGSASEKSRIFHERRRKLAELQTQADALLDLDIQSEGASATRDGPNLSNLMRRQAGELTSEIGHAGKIWN